MSHLSGLVVSVRAIHDKAEGDARRVAAVCDTCRGALTLLAERQAAPRSSMSSAVKRPSAGRSWANGTP
jgi:hypothetical protein